MSSELPRPSYGVLRDASGYRTHRYHTGVERAAGAQLSPKYHVPANDGMTQTACGRPAAEFTAERVENISLSRRCRRPGCRQGWPDA